MFHKLLSLLPPEMAHDLGISLMCSGIGAPGIWTEAKAHKLFDTFIVNRVGLAAGFDKNGWLADTAVNYGFGWVEVGSVTLRGGLGNPQPRLFRLPQGHLLNRMGLNGLTAGWVRDTLVKATPSRFAVNIAKTNDPLLVGDAAIRDIVATYKCLSRWGIYTAINVSCPNTEDGRTFERPECLAELLAALNEHRQPPARPLMVKLSSQHDYKSLSKLIDVCLAAGVDGFVSSNTQKTKHPKYGPGGLSGPLLFTANLPQVQVLVKTGKPVIACGGIATGSDANMYLKAGAVAVQAYTGFVRGPLAGPKFAHRINNYLQAQQWMQAEKEKNAD